MDSISLPLDSDNRDRLRQALNVALALGQPFTTVLAFAGTGFTLSNGADPPVVPASYAFAVWGVIYTGCLAYAAYQALPAQRENPLLRRVGFWTASAFLGTSVWLIGARLGWLWLTVACIFWMLVSLMAAFIHIIEHREPLTFAERWIAALPVGIFAGWTTVAAVANTASVLKASGWEGGGLPEGVWATGVLIIAGAVGSFVTIVSRGNPGYALTVLWALVGIVAANLATHPGVALTAGAMAGLVGGALLGVRSAR